MEGARTGGRREGPRSESRICATAPRQQYIFFLKDLKRLFHFLKKQTFCYKRNFSARNRRTRATAPTHPDEPIVLSRHATDRAVRV
jgi:hypothetical protein